MKFWCCCFCSVYCCFFFLTPKQRIRSQLGKEGRDGANQRKWGSSVERNEEKQLNNSRQKFGNGEAHIFGKDRGRGKVSNREGEEEEIETAETEPRLLCFLTELVLAENGVSKYWLLISALFIAGLTQREGKFSKPARKEEEGGEMQGKWGFGCEKQKEEWRKSKATGREREEWDILINNN